MAEPKESDKEQVQVESFDLTKIALAATVAKNGVVLLYEFMPVEEARVHAQKLMEKII